MYYCYILQNEKDGGLYVGYTKNLKERVEQHNHGKLPATKPRRPFELIFYSAFTNKYDALESEKYYKTIAGRRRIQRMLANHFEEIS